MLGTSCLLSTVRALGRRQRQQASACGSKRAHTAPASHLPERTADIALGHARLARKEHVEVLFSRAWPGTTDPYLSQPVAATFLHGTIEDVAALLVGHVRQAPVGENQ